MSSGGPDREVVGSRLAALGTTLSRLRKYSGRSLEEFREDLDGQWAAERGLQLCVQYALDLASHLNAAYGRAAPDYTAAIDGLAEHGILPSDFASRFRGIAGFRNALVHTSLKVDLEDVHRALNERLDDFAEFLEHIQAWLARSERA